MAETTELVARLRVGADHLRTTRGHQNPFRLSPELIDEAADALERQVVALVEADLWIEAALNMIDGDGLPPNWDGLRAFRKEIRALLPAPKGDKT